MNFSVLLIFFSCRVNWGFSNQQRLWGSSRLRKCNTATNELFAAISKPPFLVRKAREDKCTRPNKKILGK